MAIIDRQVKDRIVTRGLGPGPSEDLGDVVTLNFNVINFVYEEKLYFPTTGTFSQEVEGWRWDITLPQEYKTNTRQSYITSGLGGVNFNLKDGIPSSFYPGSVIEGCKLIKVNQKQKKWVPVLETGTYSVDGIERKLYSNSSISKSLTSTLDLTNYKASKDNITVAIYYRDENYRKLIYRKFEENNHIYKYSIDSNDVLSAINKEFPVGNGNVEGKINIEKSWENLGAIPNDGGNFYLKYFPVKSNSVTLKYISGSTVTELPQNLYSFDYDVGVISVNKNNIAGQVYCAYTAIPRVDIEIKDEGFYSILDIKSHGYKQSTGVIEITTEDRHVSRIDLAVIGSDQLSYGSDARQLKATVLNSLGKPVDEIDVTFFMELDVEEEARFEGNLKELVYQSNSSGESYAKINFPLTAESSSSFFNVESLSVSNQFDVGSQFLTSEYFSSTLIFEYMKVDPIYGSTGLSFTMTSSGADYIEIDLSLDAEEYVLSRNAITNSVVLTKATDANCYDEVYNSGLLILDSEQQQRFSIRKIENNRIYINGTINSQPQTVKLFKKNENETGGATP